MIYNAAIIGLGNVAWKYDRNVSDKQYKPLSHAGSYLKNKYTNLIAGCSINKYDCLEFSEYYQVQTHPTISSLLKKNEVNIASICSPTEFHYEHFMSCLDYGIPMIWLEKPSAMNIGELNHMMELAFKARTSVLVNYPRRFLDKYKILRDYFHNNKLGSPKEIVLHYSKGLFINGSHILDSLFMIIENELRYDMEDLIIIHKSENPSFMLQTSNNIPVYVIGHDVPYHSREISVFFEQGRISINQEGLQLFYEERMEQDYYPGFYRLKENTKLINLKNDFDMSMTYALDNLIDSYENKRETLSSLSTSLSTQRVTDYVLNAVHEN